MLAPVVTAPPTSPTNLVSLVTILTGVALGTIVLTVVWLLARRGIGRKRVRTISLEEELAGAAGRGKRKAVDAWSEAGRRLRVDRRGNVLPPDAPDHDTVDLDPGELSSDDIEADDGEFGPPDGDDEPPSPERGPGRGPYG